MNRKCPKCHLVNFANTDICVRCGASLVKSENITSNAGFLKSILLKRAVICLIVVIISVLGFYVSLVFSAKGLSYEERQIVTNAVSVLKLKGFDDEVFYLQKLAVFRSNDNWLNASVDKENAYAATNFPFEIMTIYPDFYNYTVDDTERAAVLLHEAKHLQGMDEREAYDYVWKHRKQLGWVSQVYRNSIVWNGVRKQTMEYSPHLFVCDEKPWRDCTE